MMENKRNGGGRFVEDNYLSEWATISSIIKN